MKKNFLAFLLIIFLSFLAFTMFCMSVNAYSGPMQDFEFYVNSQSSSPFHITISGNSTTNAYFHFYDVWSTPSARLGPYFFVSVVSNKKIDIKRANSVGSSCNQSCYSNDVYLLMTDNTAGAYGYIFYFNAKKYQDNIGSSTVIWQIDDAFKFYNKESGTADVYIYGAYANDINEIPNYINSANITTMTLDNQNQNTENIINNDDDNTNRIIEYNNNNTDKIIDSNKVCVNIDKNYKHEDNKLIKPNGTIESNNSFILTDYIYLKGGNVSVLQHIDNGYAGYSFFDMNKNYISGGNLTSLIVGELTVPSNAYYIRLSINKQDNKPQLSVCSNGNQVVNDSINNLNDNITNSGIDNPNSDFSDMEDMIAENGVITNLLSLPITLYSKILNSVNGTCSSYNLGTLFGTSITFSCISLQTLLGNTIWGVIDILFSGFTIYAIAKKMIKVFNSMSSLKEGDVIDD